MSMRDRETISRSPVTVSGKK